MVFFMSAYDVILTRGFKGVIAPKYFRFVEMIATQEVLYGPIMYT